MNRRYPQYPDDADYQTNAPSYYEDLARKQKLIEMLAKKIWEYEETLDLTLEEITNRLESYIEENDNLMKDRLEQWDLNLEKFPENVELLLQEWLSNGTLDHIINETIFNWKADKTYVDSEIERLDLKDENITAQLAQNTRAMINLKGVGAKADYQTSKTNDAPIIQSVINSVDDGTVIYFPPGSYYIGSTTLKMRNHTTLLGDGASIYYDGTGSAIQTYTTNGVNTIRPYINNLNIRKVGSDKIGTGIEIDNVSAGVVIEGGSVDGFEYGITNGVKDESAWISTIRDVEIRENNIGFYGGRHSNAITIVSCNIRHNVQSGVKWMEGSNNAVINSTFEYNGLVENGNAIHAGNVNRLTIADNYFEHNGNFGNDGCNVLLDTLSRQTAIERNYFHGEHSKNVIKVKAQAKGMNITANEFSQHNPPLDFDIDMSELSTTQYVYIFNNRPSKTESINMPDVNTNPASYIKHGTIEYTRYKKLSGYQPEINLHDSDSDRNLTFKNLRGSFTILNESEKEVFKINRLKESMLLTVENDNSAKRPTENLQNGRLYYDKTLKKLIIWEGSKWIDVMGNDV